MRISFLLTLAYLVLFTMDPPRLFTATCAMGVLVGYLAIGNMSRQPKSQKFMVRGMIPLMAFVFLYYAIGLLYEQADVTPVMRHVAFIVVSYLIGYYAVESDAKRAEREGIWLLLATIVGSTIYTMGCLRISGASLFAGSTERLFIDFWGAPHGATNLVTKATIGGAVLAAAIIKMPQMKWLTQWAIRGSLLACGACSIYATLITGTRSAVFILAAANLGILLIIAYQIIRRGWKKSDASIWVAICLGLLIAYGLHHVNISEIMSESLTVHRFEIAGMEGGGRAEATTRAFAGLLEHPMGGKLTALPLEQVHNLWGDVAWATGIFPLACLIFFNVQHIVLTVRVFLNPAVGLLWKCLVTGTLGVFFVSACVEPAIEGLLHCFCVYVMICGMTRRLYVEQCLAAARQLCCARSASNGRPPGPGPADGRGRPNGNRAIGHRPFPRQA